MMSLESPSDFASFEAFDWSWEGFSLKRETHKFEQLIIQRALRDSAGSVTAAAHLLGFKHHQSVISLISGRHKELESHRSRSRKRHRTLFSKATVTPKTRTTTAKPLVLHVSYDQANSKVTADLLSGEETQFDPCLGGEMALRKLSRGAQYDLIILDIEREGLEIVRRVRKMPKYRGTPILMLSGEECEDAAWRAGISDFLRKPQDLSQLKSRIDRLLASLRDPTA